MNKKIVYLLIFSILLIYVPLQKVYSYNDNVRYIRETDKNKFDSFMEDEILIILDTSSALSQQVNNGNSSLADTAISSVYSILKSVPPDTRIGLRVFGSGSNIGYNSCSATKLIVPIGSNSSQYIKNFLSGISSFYGPSPITLSLKNAIENDFKSLNTTKHIILIAASNDTCNNSPCSFINNVLQYRNDIIIDVIALGFDINTSNQLQCLADKTGGEYIPVKSNEKISINVNTTVVYMDGDSNNKDNNSTEVKFPPPNNKIKYTNYLFEFSI